MGHTFFLGVFLGHAFGWFPWFLSIKMAHFGCWPWGWDTTDPRRRSIEVPRKKKEWTGTMVFFFVPWRHGFFSGAFRDLFLGEIDGFSMVFFFGILKWNPSCVFIDMSSVRQRRRRRRKAGTEWDRVTVVVFKLWTSFRVPKMNHVIWKWSQHNCQHRLGISTPSRWFPWSSWLQSLHVSSDFLVIPSDFLRVHQGKTM